MIPSLYRLKIFYGAGLSVLVALLGHCDVLGIGLLSVHLLRRSSSGGRGNAPVQLTDQESLKLIDMGARR